MMSGAEFVSINPEVSPEAEFFEILNDFSDPLELVREAISNSVDWGASYIKIKFSVESVEGITSLVINLEDDGEGMTEEAASKDFWGLGFSKSREDAEKIGEKGHGTKIYLRSRRVHLRSQSAEGAYEAICEYPLKALSQRQLHQPKIREIGNFLQTKTGTQVTITGYNNDERSTFTQAIVKDYILWFTKQGSIEREFGIEKLKDFKVYLWCLDKEGNEYEEIPFGHPFPKENANIDKLFEKYSADAADVFVKRYSREARLTRHPEVTFKAVIYVEGDDAKRKYNPMIRLRRDKRSGTYRVGDRYGIWLCKDFIPIQRVNDWITGFGSGSNAIVLLHGFVNCQNLKLTANRGNISNTDPQILEELKEVVASLVEEVDTDLKKKSLYILRGWQQETRTLKQEEDDFDTRLKRIKGKRVANLNKQPIYEPQSESEVFGIFLKILTMRPDLFEFEPLDYNTYRGIDILAKIKGVARVSEGEFGYVELKHFLKNEFNHAFRFLKWIICWDFHRDISNGAEFIGVEENDVRTLTIEEDKDGHPLYFLDAKGSRVRIQIIRLEEFLANKLRLKFQKQVEKK